MTQVVLARELDNPRRTINHGQKGLMWLALPSVVWYFIFTIGPLVAMFYLSFFEWRSLAAKQNFNGIDNYIRMFTSEQFHDSIGVTAIHMVASIPFMMVASFMIGYALNLKPKGHRILRVLMFAPALISLSALGTMFIAVLGPKGLINGALESIGLGELGQPWLANPSFALPSIIGITIWSGMGFNAILFAARLSAVPSEIYEAAELDGASHWTKMWRVAFPITIDYFGVLTMLQYLWNLFGSAGLILLLTNGGPGTSTTTLSWLVYQNAFLSNRIGYSQAIGVLLFVLGVIGLLVIRRVFRQRY
jgi:ABC-type sugar transport system permease subunit